MTVLLQVKLLVIIHNAIQLNNGGVFSTVTGSGRVEICVCTNSSLCYWQTISTGSLTEPISWKNSIVICRHLYYKARELL